VELTSRIRQLVRLQRQLPLMGTTHFTEQTKACIERTPFDETSGKRMRCRDLVRRASTISVSCPWDDQVFKEEIMTDARYYVVGDRSSSQSMPHKSSACGASAPMCAWWMMTTASNDASGRDTPASRPRCRSWASCSTTMTRVRAPRRWWR
jgi:hypothetical protein